ncbi:UV-endonuclease UvdE-domain-containing protein [Microdochium trichocladiopsis]|uniref:UV-endonuclease UvdE-domain-containing protein n=1 Tax=Microdochium trichocladiopsis TaxID=1682393 RepID=A0A9P8Y9L2_9PEZI|nr:UV-endonuclease UvdE-domain-containing protein [Microdochium trichocladiopsis]KAH7033617.1 UV-endonuclease UvdE-domain-containing protein [Microdochium trichocladiopsis]
MGQRRKRSSAAATAADTEEPHGVRQQTTPPGSEEPANTMPSLGPRRSGRHVKDGVGLRAKNDDSLAGAKTNGSNKASAASTGRDKRRTGKNKSDGDQMDIAMEGLREMEYSFRDAVKRQKLAVGETSFSIPPDAIHDETNLFNAELRTGTSEMLTANDEAPKATKDDQTQAIAWGRTPPREKIDQDPESPCEDEVEGMPLEDESSAIRQAAWRPPPVNSDILPLPWKGRLGYDLPYRVHHRAQASAHAPGPARTSHQEPPRQEATRRCGTWTTLRGEPWTYQCARHCQNAAVERQEYGYKLAPFASEVLADAGKVAGELGHRLTTHPGQFTQLGSPRNEVVRNAIRDLEYHDEMLTLLRLPEQQNKDAVMILHMGGVFGDKAATLDRFRENYAKLSPSIKARLVLENDDVSWHVHDLLPICEELNIPMVLDYHHHNIMFDADKIREGTHDIIDLYPRIRATWTRKGITQKMHYSEPCPEAITGRQRRKHSPRVATLPPCANDMDLMIEAKDKEQAVFALMRNFKLPGWDRINDIAPHERDDENKPPPKATKKKAKKSTPKKKTDKAAMGQDEDGDAAMPDTADPPEAGEDEAPNKEAEKIPESEVSMGGPDGRVFWPQGMEEWLRPKKRLQTKKMMSKPDGKDDEE